MKTTKCERCKRKFREDDLDVDEDSGDLLCPSCLHNDETDSEVF